MRGHRSYEDGHHKKKHQYKSNESSSYKNDYNKTNVHGRIRKYHNNKRNSYHHERGRHNRRYDNQEYEHTRVKISNLEYTVSKDDLIDIFSDECKIVDAWVNYDRTDRSEGTAVCIFENLHEARKAVEKYDGSKVDGLAIQMEILPGRFYKPYNQKRNKCPW